LFFFRLLELGIRIIIKKKKREERDSTKATHTLIAFGQSLQRRDKERKTNTHTRARGQKRFCSNKKNVREQTREEKKKKKKKKRTTLCSRLPLTGGHASIHSPERRKKDEENVMHNL